MLYIEEGGYDIANTNNSNKINKLLMKISFVSHFHRK
jgi:hypothetical protein